MSGAKKKKTVSHSFDEQVSLVRKTLEDMKAEDVSVLNLSGLSVVADCFVIATGLSLRHLQAMADEVARQMREAGYGRIRQEGAVGSSWILMDLGDVVLHLFDGEARRLYALEDLWHS